MPKTTILNFLSDVGLGSGTLAGGEDCDLSNIGCLELV